MKVELLHYTPYEVLMRAIRMSRDSLEKMDTEGNILGDNDKSLLATILTLRHDSVLEHIVYTFLVEDISRAVLVELERHRLISLTVKSTRYTLKKDIQRGEFKLLLPKEIPEPKRAEFEKLVRKFIVENLERGNDIAKYFLPEAYPTKLVMTVNARELSHVITLRIRPGVLREFRRLVVRLFRLAHDVHPELWSMIAERENLWGDIWEVEQDEV